MRTDPRLDLPVTYVMGRSAAWPPLTKPARKERQGEGGWIIGAFQLLQSDILATGHRRQMAYVKLFVAAPNSVLRSWSMWS